MDLWGEKFLLCHAGNPDHRSFTKDDEDLDKYPQCRGAAIYRANACKRPGDPRMLVLPRDVVLVFANAREFLAHHSQFKEMKK